MLCHLLLSLLPAAPPAQEPRPPVQLPAGLADPLGRTAALANRSGGLDVVDLTTGDLLWETKEAQRPVLIHGRRLYAQAAVGTNGLRLLAFDLAEEGPCVFTSATLLFPDWVDLTEGPGRSFTAQWQRDGHRLVLTWQAAAWNAAGPELFRLTGRPAAATGTFAAASSRVDRLDAQPHRRQAAGRAAFDLETGRVQRLADPAPPAVAPLPPAEACKLALRWQGEIDGNFSALTLESMRDRTALVLRSWDRVTGQQAPPRELLRGTRLVVLPSVDGRLLCLRDTVPSPDERSKAPEPAGAYAWSVFAPATGKLVTRLPFEPGTQAIALAGPRAYLLVAAPLRGRIDRPFVREQVLRAIDVASGKLLWERPVEGRSCVPPGG